jgi:hypothetical protein
MSAVAWRGLAGLGVLAALAGLRVVSFVPYTAERDAGGIVRLAWRARGERVQDCRRRTSEELAKLPVHMRQAEVCEGRVLPYRLSVALDDTQVVNRLVHGAGAREDRPLYVYQELAARPGTHHLTVQFTLEGGPRPGSLPAAQSRLVLDTTIVLRSRRVVLVTCDEERELLVLRAGSAR